MAVIVGHVTRIAELVQLREGVDPGHRDEAPSPEASHLAFHAALLVRALHTGDAEERVEAVVRAQRHEPLALGAVPSRRTLVTAEVKLSYLKLGQAPEGLGGPDVPVEEPPGTRGGRRGGSPSPTRLGRSTNIFPTTRRGGRS